MTTPATQPSASTDAFALARALMDHARWQWCVGMRARVLVGPVRGSWLVVHADAERVALLSAGQWQPGQLLPDLSDDATVGVLFGWLVRESKTEVRLERTQHGWSADRSIEACDSREDWIVVEGYEQATPGQAVAWALLNVWDSHEEASRCES